MTKVVVSTSQQSSSFFFLMLHWVFAAAPGLSLVVASRGYSCCGAGASHCGGFSCCGTRALGMWGSTVVACGSRAQAQ